MLRGRDELIYACYVIQNVLLLDEFTPLTRMHSSRMRTDRSSRCTKWRGGVLSRWGLFLEVSIWGVCVQVISVWRSISTASVSRVSLSTGVLCHRDPLPSPSVDRMTHASENITFPQLRLRAGKLVQRIILYYCVLCIKIQ